jgi:hypothetical protein
MLKTSLTHPFFLFNKLGQLYPLWVICSKKNTIFYKYKK